MLKRPPREVWAQTLVNASTYDEWAEAAQNLDVLLGLDMWRQNPTSKDYDYRLINERVRLIQAKREQGDVYGLLNALRTGLVRNLGNITSPKLFNHSFAGTKHLIEEYIQQYVEAIQEITSLPPPLDSGSGTGTHNDEMMAPDWEDGEISGGSGGIDENDAASRRAGAAVSFAARPRKGGMATATIQTQHKLDFIHNSRQGFGRSALVLQGGAIFGLCHLGVVKALFLRGMLPRVIVGTATGAMMAALVGVHPEEDLLRILTGDGIDLSAFAGKGQDPDQHNQEVRQSMWTRWATLIRRVRRFRKEGYFLDVKVLEECVRANIGDLTFEEAFNRSRRILNITVVTAGQQGVPTLLNHVTAPNVVSPSPCPPRRSPFPIAPTDTPPSWSGQPPSPPTPPPRPSTATAKPKSSAKTSTATSSPGRRPQPSTSATGPRPRTPTATRPCSVSRASSTSTTSSSPKPAPT
jgi:TAG lipase/lysophosphatidylethanolamine acyltransferase